MTERSNKKKYPLCAAALALAVLLAYMGAITLGFNTVDRLREDSAVTAEQ